MYWRYTIMNETDLLKGEELCKECGLCCQGVFHPTALLYTKEDISIAKNANITFDFNKDLKSYMFALPCPAFDSICSIYPNRPSVCSVHKCDLLKTVMNGTCTLENALIQVKKIKKILTTLIPKLKNINNNNETSYPRDLVKNIFESFKNDQAKIEFKQENKKILMEYGAFCILEEKYFYKKSEYLL